ncbi:hypothetical protein FHS18_003299 [Paenibacillus phyllosphaerae]|uniref:Holin-like toxin n=1 Tax=Paenibacillus phyllosphaerae TaxID=274593 RepID=A0A7W5B033_9BACL|nr:hypothetical protein [Paenibacillus phyllosphaerae]
MEVEAMSADLLIQLLMLVIMIIELAKKSDRP